MVGWGGGGSPVPEVGYSRCSDRMCQVYIQLRSIGRNEYVDRRRENEEQIKWIHPSIRF